MTKKPEEIKKEPLPIVEKAEEVIKQPPKRQIIIETDGNNINILKADVAGTLELVAILQSILNNLANKRTNK